MMEYSHQNLFDAMNKVLDGIKEAEVIAENLHLYEGQHYGYDVFTPDVFKSWLKELGYDEWTSAQEFWYSSSSTC